MSEEAPSGGGVSRRRTRAEFALAIGPVVLAVAAAGSVPWLSAHRSDLAGAALWGLVVLVSFVGWGGAVAAVLAPGRRLDWGLRSAIGMAWMVAVGGTLQVVRLVAPWSIVTLIAGGLAALAVARTQRRSELVLELREARAGARREPVMTAAIACMGVLMLALYVGHVATIVANPWDDYEAYFVYPKAMLAWGALEEPFSLRRLGGLGGHSLLQAFQLTGSTVWRLNALDAGVCVLSIFGMVAGYARGRRAAALLGMLFVAAFTHHILNVASAQSGTVFFLALFRVFDGGLDGDPSSRRGPLLVGLLAAAAWTLRQNYLAAVLGVLVAVYAARWLDQPPQARREVARGLGRALGATLLFLLPWWIVSYRSSGTFLYPIMVGNGRPEFGLSEHLRFAEEARFFLFNVLWNRPVRSLWLFVLAAVCLEERPRDRTIQAFLVGTALGGAALIHSLQAFDDVDSLSRYYMSFEYALVLAILSKTLARAAPDDAAGAARGRSFLAAALVVVAVGIHFYDARDDIAAEWNEHLDRVATQLFKKADKPDVKDLAYQRLQAAVPAGAPLLEMLDEPFRLDFRRNRVLIWDEPGGADPKPGLPVHQGAERYEAYFRSGGLRYIAYSLGADSPEYDLPRWTRNRDRAAVARRTGTTRGDLLKHMGVFYADAFQTLIDMTRRHRELFHEGSMHLIDLESPPAP